MNIHLKLILSTFTKQRRPNDCGLACLASVFKYAGLKVVPFDEANFQQVSLLQLDTLAKDAGLSTSCVKMDLTTLHENHSPCILHIVNDAGQPHFIVHYPYWLKSGFHLVGDPDRKLEMISEEALLQKWVSRAGLYFENLKPNKAYSVRFFPWNAFLEYKFIPKVLWVSIPFLNIVAAFLGLAVSLIIQKAVEPGFINSRESFFVLLFILLGLISFAKCLLNYLRQWLMITIGMKIDSKLSSAFLQHTYQAFKSSAKLPGHFYMNSIADVQKIHQSIALLVGVVFSDGLLVMLMFGGLYYYQPALVILQIAVFLAMLLVIDNFLPLMMIYIDYMQPNLGSSNSKGVIGADGFSGIADFDFFSEGYFKLNNDFSNKTKAMSGLVNKLNLSFEAISTVSLVIVLILSINNLQANLISYEGFLMSIFLCYGMGMLMSKICNQLFVIAQGADRLKQNLSEVHKSH